MPDRFAEEPSMQRTLPEKGQLPHALYRADQVRELDRCAIEDQGIPGETLGVPAT